MISQRHDDRVSDSEIVFRTYESVQADLVEASLRASGLTYHRSGASNAALVGMGPSILEQTFAVSSHDATRARELVAELFASPGPSSQPAKDQSLLRRIARPLVRAWLLGFAGFYFSLAVKLVCVAARNLSVPSANLFDLSYFPGASWLSGIAVAFVPAPYRGTVLASAAAGLLLAGILLSRP